MYDWLRELKETSYFHTANKKQTYINSVMVIIPIKMCGI
jgi:hypothetical protein